MCGDGESVCVCVCVEMERERDGHICVIKVLSYNQLDIVNTVWIPTTYNKILLREVCV